MRYADDCSVYVRSEAAGERVMASLEGFLTKRLRLKVNRDKSAVARPWDRTFLGYSFTADREPKLEVARRSVQRLKDKLRVTFRAARGRRLTDTIATLVPIIRGWTAYYRLSRVKNVFEELDPWLRRKLRAVKLRAVLWKRWGPGKTWPMARSYPWQPRPQACPNRGHVGDGRSPDPLLRQEDTHRSDCPHPGAGPDGPDLA